MASTDLSPAGLALGLGDDAESEQAKKKRLAALQNSRDQITRSLGGSNSNMSPASQYLMNFGGGLGLGSGAG
jgi:hypothetical protein